MGEITDMRSAADGLPKGFVKADTPDLVCLSQYLFLHVAEDFSGQQTAGLIRVVEEALKDGDTEKVANYLAANPEVDLGANILLRGISPSDAMHPEQISLLKYMLGDDLTSERKQTIAAMLKQPERREISGPSVGIQPQGTSLT